MDGFVAAACYFDDPATWLWCAAADGSEWGPAWNMHLFRDLRRADQAARRVPRGRAMHFEGAVRAYVVAARRMVRGA